MVLVPFLCYPTMKRSENHVGLKMITMYCTWSVLLGIAHHQYTYSEYWSSIQKSIHHYVSGETSLFKIQYSKQYSIQNLIATINLIRNDYLSSKLSYKDFNSDEK